MIAPFPDTRIVGWLNQRKPFAHARYSDGEWKLMTGCKWGGRVPRLLGDTRPAIAQVGEALRRTVRAPYAPPYYYGLHHIVLEADFLKCKMDSLHLPEIAWVDALALKRANGLGGLAAFIRALSGLRVCLVGPAYLEPLEFLTSAGHIETDFPGAYLHRDEILRRAVKTQADVFVFSASALTNVLMYDLWDGVRTLIDCGALWEDYVGRYIPYHGKRPEERGLSREVMRKNLEGCDEQLRLRLLKRIVPFAQYTSAFPIGE